MKTTILLILFSIFTSGLLACSCPNLKYLCKTISLFEDQDFQNWAVMVDAIVTEVYDDGIDITIQEVLDGELVVEEEIFIKSGFIGGGCTHPTSEFSLDENYLFILEKPSDNYQLNKCWVSFLKIEDGMLIGPIAPNVGSYPYDGNSFEYCPSLLDLFSIDNSLTVAPNPFINNIVRIKNITEYEANGIFHLEIFDTMGRKVTSLRKEDGLQEEEEWVINNLELASGLYFFRIKFEDNERVFRVIKHDYLWN